MYIPSAAGDTDSVRVTAGSYSQQLGAIASRRYSVQCTLITAVGQEFVLFTDSVCLTRSNFRLRDTNIHAGGIIVDT